MFLNVIFYLVIMYKVIFYYLFIIYSSSTLFIINFNFILIKVYTLSGEQKDIITVMCGRLQYYCLVQIISRIGATWYQLQYGFIETVDMSDASPFEMAVFTTQFMLTPSAGIGYLIVFLTMQPEAYQHYQDLIRKIQKYFNCRLCNSCLENTTPCQCCCIVPTAPKRVRRVVYRLSEDTVTTAMEQRLVEDINNNSGNCLDISNESDSENSKRKAVLRQVTISKDSSIDRENGESYSSSYFVDDQDLAEELERMYREGKCGVTTIE